MTYPTIHLNGTDKEDLIAQYEKALTALHEAYDAIREAAPNGRDYYPQGQNAIQIAIAEHGKRLDRITAVRREIEDILSDILDH